MIAILRGPAGQRPRNLDLFSEHGTPEACAAFRVCNENSQQLPQAPTLRLPAHHDVRGADVNSRNSMPAADRGPKDFAELLLIPGLGARTVASLAFVAEVIHGAPYRFSDPGRFSLASVLKRAIGNARLGRREELDTIKRLDDQSRMIDKVARTPSFAQ
jgi:uncharacterized protein